MLERFKSRPKASIAISLVFLLLCCVVFVFMGNFDLGGASKPKCAYADVTGQKADEYNRFVASLNVREEVDLRFEINELQSQVENMTLADGSCTTQVFSSEIEIGERDYVLQSQKEGQYGYVITLQQDDRDAVLYYVVL